MRNQEIAAAISATSSHRHWIRRLPSLGTTQNYAARLLGGRADHGDEGGRASLPK
jgi:hypothetical protein